MKIGSLKICLQNRLDMYTEFNVSDSPVRNLDRWFELSDVVSNLRDLQNLLEYGLTYSAVVNDDDKATLTMARIVDKWCDLFDKLYAQLGID